MEEKIIRISVRNLVEFILREGDIDNRKGGIPDKEAWWADPQKNSKADGIRLPCGSSA